MTHKRIRIPWWDVPRHILIGLVECKGLDPRKMKWYWNIEENALQVDKPEVDG